MTNHKCPFCGINHPCKDEFCVLRESISCNDCYDKGLIEDYPYTKGVDNHV